jgi:hypothetical protein
MTNPYGITLDCEWSEWAANIVSDTPSAAAHRIDASSSVIPYGFGMPKIYPADGLDAAGAAARNISYDREHELAERLQLLPLWGLQGLPWHHISRWRPQCQSAQ